MRPSHVRYSAFAVTRLVRLLHCSANMSTPRAVFDNRTLFACPRGTQARRALAALAVAASVAACRPAPPAPDLPAQAPHRVGPAEDRFDPATLAPIEGDLAARLHLVDVGQGAALLVELSCGVVLVDAGGEASRDFSARETLTAYLEAFFGRRPDLARTIALLVVTHPHIDHTRGLKSVVEDFVVENVVTDGRTSGSGGAQQRWLQKWAADSARLETVASEKVPPGGLTSSTIDPIRCKDVDPAIRALWGSVAERPAGWTKDAFEDENNHSVVLRVDAGRASFLVGGDLETHGMDAVIAKHRRTAALDVDVLLVNHHGSANGTTKPWLDATTPAVALVSMGPKEREGMWTAWAFGHPRRGVLDLLHGSTIGARPRRDVTVATRAETFEKVSLERAVYATGWDGDVAVTATRSGSYRVQTRR
jgi:competence protein ComEC